MERSKRYEASPNEPKRTRDIVRIPELALRCHTLVSYALYMERVLGKDLIARVLPLSLLDMIVQPTAKSRVGKRGWRLETGLMLFAANKNHDCGFFLFVFRRNPNLRVTSRLQRVQHGWNREIA